MKVLLLQHNFLHAVTTSPLVEVTLLLWSGKAIWMKMNKNSLKILVLNQLQTITHEECHHQKDQLLLPRDKEPQEVQKLEAMDHHKNQPMAKHPELVEI